MGTIRGLLRGVNRLQVPIQVVKIIQSDSKEIIQLNQNQLFKRGEDKLGVPLPDYKSKVYAAEKVFKNPQLPFGRPDLKLTGAFYRGFNLTVGYSGIFTLDSSDSKTAKLTNRYGIYIFGLSAESRHIYATGTFYTKLKTYIGKTTGLVFR